MAQEPRSATVTITAAPKPETEAAPSPQAAPAPQPTTTVGIVGFTPSSLDNQFQNLGPVAGTGYSTLQPVWPTAWPPNPPPPAPELNYSGLIPWRSWQAVLAVRSYATDPPPCPVVISSYPGLTR